MQRFNLIAVAILLIFLTLLGCKRDDISSTKNQIIQIIWGGGNESLSDGKELFWSSLPSVDIVIDEIVLPSGKTIKNFNEVQLYKKAVVQSKSDLLIRDLSIAAKNIISFNQFTDNEVGISNKPFQTKLGYSWGQKKYKLRLTPPGANAGCNNMIYGLDCSGFIWNVFKECHVEIIGESSAYADILRKTNLIEKAIKNSDRDFQNVKVSDLNKITIEEMRTGDIIYWKDSSGVAEHIGLILIDEKGNKNVAQSNGKRTASCIDNIASNRGPRFTNSLGKAILPASEKGFGNDYGIVRIEEKVPCNEQTQSGGYGVTRNTHTMGTENGVIKIDYDMYPIPDKLDVYYNGTIVATTNTPVSGGGSLTFNYNYKNQKDYIEVVVTGNIQGTAWTYTVGCPK